MQYVRSDHSANTSVRVLSDRTISPRGALIHSTSGVSSEEWLTGGSAKAGNPASANALITKTGEQIIICPNNKFPYHAGKSRLELERTYTGDEVSQVLIGIELEYLDTETPNTIQYDSLSDIIIWYSRLYQWRWPHLIMAHSGVALPLGRRSDPVSFDWGHLMGRLYVHSLAAELGGLV